jgi:hypothetical protein
VSAQAWPRSAKLDAPRLVERIAEITGVRLVLEGPCPGGEVGAAYVRWPDGRRSVLSEGRSRTGPVLDLARAAGVPTARQELSAHIDGVRVIVQQRLPGTPPATIDAFLVHQMVAINDRLAGLLADPPPERGDAAHLRGPDDTRPSGRAPGLDEGRPSGRRRPDDTRHPDDGSLAGGARRSDDARPSHRTGHSHDARPSDRTGHSDDARPSERTGRSDDMLLSGSPGRFNDVRLSGSTGRSGDTPLPGTAGRSGDMHLSAGARRAARFAVQPVDLYLIDDGPGFCLHDPLAKHSNRTARLLARIREVGAAGTPTDGDDLVHFDYTPANVLVDNGHITGVIDWDGASRGDRHLDLVVLRFYLMHQAPHLVGIVDDRLAGADPDRLRAYWAHISLRQVDWSIRHHDAAAVDQWLDVAEPGMR